MRYWSSSNFWRKRFQQLGLTIPDSDTREHWEEFDQKAKQEHPFLFWLYDTALDANGYQMHRMVAALKKGVE